MLLLPEAFNFLKKYSCTSCVPMFCLKDTNGEIRDFDVAGQGVYLSQDTNEEYSPYDLAWQALHVAAAAACRGSTPTGGSGTHINSVLTRNSRGPKSCKQLCSESGAAYCDAEVSIYGGVGKANTNGQTVGTFYNYDCDTSVLGYGRDEANAAEEEIMKFHGGAFSFCCCR